MRAAFGLHRRFLAALAAKRLDGPLFLFIFDEFQIDKSFAVSNSLLNMHPPATDRLQEDVAVSHSNLFNYLNIIKNIYFRYWSANC
jgi:hypothetical protein